MKKRVLLLTGATGFLGSHLLRKLVQSDCKVILIKRSFSNVDRIKDLLKDDRVVFHDLDTQKLEDIFINERIDSIIHTATEYGRGDESISKILEANLNLPIKLIELAIKYNVTSFINTDSYFNKENLSYSSLLNYSLSKKVLLKWLTQLSPKIRVVNIILEHMYGPYDSRSKFVEYLIQEIGIHKRKEIDLTHGHQKRDFVYVGDVVDAFTIIIEHSLIDKSPYSTFEVGYGQSVEVREVAELIKKISGSNTCLNFGKVAYRSDEIMESKANLRHITSLGWSPKTRIMNGISSILELYSDKSLER
jgi:nucleoside-diphosphate-sugar epimerase